MAPAKREKIAALAGGVGASKLLLGLYDTMDPRDLTVIVNTGDDITLHGLKISPDLDIVTYTLAGIVDEAKGWGYREAMLADDKSLSEAAEAIRVAVGVKARILPMSDQPVPTMIATDEGELHFQEYLVKRRAEPVIRGIRFDAADTAGPANGVLEAIRDAYRILVCPSNPLISIGPILGVRGIREALHARKKRVVAVCPIVRGKSLKGPSDKMLAELGYEPSALGVARLYADFSGTLVVDPADKKQTISIRKLGMKVEVIPTVMTTRAQKRELARALLALKI